MAISPAEPLALQCERWLRAHIAADTQIIVPEIVEYELRRELIRLGRIRSLLRLDTLLIDPGVTYLPIAPPAMRLAANLWAEARCAGRPTADSHALDGDVILAAQTRLLADDGHSAIVATTNLRHLSLLSPPPNGVTIASDA